MTIEERRKIRQEAQRELLLSMGLAFSQDNLDPKVVKQMDVLMRRIEKQWGWVEGSFTRGA